MQATACPLRPNPHLIRVCKVIMLLCRTLDETRGPIPFNFEFSVQSVSVFKFLWRKGTQSLAALLVQIPINDPPIWLSVSRHLLIY